MLKDKAHFSFLPRRGSRLVARKENYLSCPIGAQLDYFDNCMWYKIIYPSLDTVSEAILLCPYRAWMIFHSYMLPTYSLLRLRSAHRLRGILTIARPLIFTCQLQTDLQWSFNQVDDGDMNLKLKTSNSGLAFITSHNWIPITDHRSLTISVFGSRWSSAGYLDRW